MAKRPKLSKHLEHLPSPLRKKLAQAARALESDIRQAVKGTPEYKKLVRMRLSQARQNVYRRRSVKIAELNREAYQFMQAHQEIPRLFKTLTAIEAEVFRPQALPKSYKLADINHAIAFMEMVIESERLEVENAKLLERFFKDKKKVRDQKAHEKGRLTTELYLERSLRTKDHLESYKKYFRKK